jgi:PQQ-dependent dehydrogenase (methanol/ethanol family)
VRHPDGGGLIAEKADGALVVGGVLGGERRNHPDNIVDRSNPSTTNVSNGEDTMTQAQENTMHPASDPATLTGPTAAPTDDWPSYNRTLDGNRFSPLSEITPANVAGLTQVCSYTLPAPVSLQTGMTVIDGTMYFSHETGSYAIDAATGQEKWKYERPLTGEPSGTGAQRGMAFYDGKLFRGTTDLHVFALDAGSGKLVWDVEIPEPAFSRITSARHDENAPRASQTGVSLPMAPIAWNGLVFIGTAGGDNCGVIGHVYAFDAQDGCLVWTFATVPAQGPARATWTNPRLPVSGGAYWTSFSLDESTGVLYVPAGNPAPDFDVEMRTGDNLYSNSVIALDARTGGMLAYNQLVKLDNHDWDVSSAPTLVTTRGGQKIIASANKDGLLSVLDGTRVPAQPTPTSALAPEIPLLWQQPTTTRANVEVPLNRKSKTRFSPGIIGGTEWNGAAYSPQTNLLYVGAVDWASHVQLKRKFEIPAQGQPWFGSENALDDMFDPVEQSRGWLTAFNAETGTVRWRFQTPRPILAGVTPTASGLVFTADVDGNIYALDADNGQVLWRTTTGIATGGGVITYRAGGQQLLAVAAGMAVPWWPGASEPSRIIIYGLT